MTKEDLFNIYKKAIEHESEAFGFYQKAALKTIDHQTKKLFEEFANMEEYQLNRLKDRYRELRETASDEARQPKG